MIWRVRARQDFEQLRKGSRRRAGPLTVTRGTVDPAHPPKVAYAIGRKVGNAPERNLLRRRIRAILATEAPHLERSTFLITARPGAAQLSFDQLRTYLMDALRALNTLSRADHD